MLAEVFQVDVVPAGVLYVVSEGCVILKQRSTTYWHLQQPHVDELGANFEGFVKHFSHLCTNIRILRVRLHIIQNGWWAS